MLSTGWPSPIGFVEAGTKAKQGLWLELVEVTARTGGPIYVNIYIYYEAELCSEININTSINLSRTQNVRLCPFWHVKSGGCTAFCWQFAAELL